MTILRDIRSDLETRLAMVVAKLNAVKTEHEHELKALHDRMMAKASGLHEERTIVEAMLRTEKRRLGDVQDAAPTPAQDVRLGDFFLDVLRKMGPKNKEQLHGLARAEGYFGDDPGGRATNITLANFVRAERVMVDEDGNYRLPEEVAATTAARIGTGPAGLTGGPGNAINAPRPAGPTTMRRV